MGEPATSGPPGNQKFGVSVLGKSGKVLLALRRPLSWDIPIPRTTMLPGLFVLLLVIGYGEASPRHVRGEAGGVDSEERRNGEDTQHRVLPTLAEYDIKGEDKYSSCPEGYPAFGTLGDLLKAWSPNQPEVPQGGVIERLRVRAPLPLLYILRGLLIARAAAS